MNLNFERVRSGSEEASLLHCSSFNSKCRASNVGELTAQAC